jgi:hypothetical protein
MKREFFVLNILWIVAIITCVICAFIGSIHKTSGWGWFLLVAVLFGAALSWSDSDNEKEDSKESNN